MADSSNQTYKVARILLFSINFIFPRFFGLLPLQYDMKIIRLRPSRLWHIYCIIVGVTFTFGYPYALYKIFMIKKNANVDKSNISQVTEILNYIAIYCLSLAVYVHQIFFGRYIMNFINAGLHLYDRVEVLDANIMDAKLLLFQYVFRAIFTYSGKIAINYVTILYLSGDMSGVNTFWKILYCMPDIVTVSTNMRFHSTIMMQIVICRRICGAFKQCLDRVSRVSERSSTERMKVCEAANERFNFIALYYMELYRTARCTEKLLATIIMFIIINSILNLTTTVSLELMYFVFVSLCFTNFGDS